MGPTQVTGVADLGFVATQDLGDVAVCSRVGWEVGQSDERGGTGVGAFDLPVVVPVVQHGLPI